MYATITLSAWLHGKWKINSECHLQLQPYHESHSGLDFYPFRDVKALKGEEICFCIFRSNPQPISIQGLVLVWIVSHNELTQIRGTGWAEAKRDKTKPDGPPRENLESQTDYTSGKKIWVRAQHCRQQPKRNLNKTIKRNESSWCLLPTH